MTQFILVRHANPDYTVTEKKGLSKDVAPLSEIGIQQAIELSKDNIFDNADVLISSPFTRAQQTARYIVLAKKLPAYTENDLRRSKFNFEMLQTRTLATSVLDKYLNCSKVIVVTHAEVILFLTGKWINQGEYITWEYNGK